MKAKRAAKAPITGSAIDVLRAMMADEADEFRDTLPAAERLLPILLAGDPGLNICAIDEMAERLLRETLDVESYRLKDFDNWQALLDRLPPNDVEMVSAVRYSTAGAAFSLGIAAGLRLGGGR